MTTAPNAKCKRVLVLVYSLYADAERRWKGWFEGGLSWAELCWGRYFAFNLPKIHETV